MGELETLMKIMEKLQEVEELKKRVENLENKIEELSNDRINSAVSKLSTSSGNTEDNLATAADLAILHWKKNPPRGY